MSKKLWGGRFQEKIDARFEKFSASLRWDRRLLPYDLKIDAAHVKALRRCGVLSDSEAKKLSSAILRLEKEYQSGSLKLKEDSEDVHSAIQLELERQAGPLAYKLHTARSRNDLVSQSSRLYCPTDQLLPGYRISRVLFLPTDRPLYDLNSGLVMPPWS